MKKGTATFQVFGKFPTLNEVLQSARNGFAYNKVKRNWEARIVRATFQIPRFERVRLFYKLWERDKRRDPSNVAAVAVKFIEDALVKAWVLPNDGWGVIEGYSVIWSLEKGSGVEVTIEGELSDETRTDARSAAAKRKFEAQARTS